MRNPVIFGVASALFLLSLQAHADAMGEGLGFDVGAPETPSVTQEAPSTRRGPPLSSLNIPAPEAVPEPQCVSGGQPCAEEAEQANKKAKADKDKE